MTISIGQGATSKSRNSRDTSKAGLHHKQASSTNGKTKTKIQHEETTRLAQKSTKSQTKSHNHEDKSAEYKGNIHKTPDITYIPPHKSQSHHDTPGIYTPHSTQQTNKHRHQSKKNNIGLWMVLCTILIIVILGIFKIYLDSLTQSLDENMISEELVGQSFYIAKDNDKQNYNLVSEDQKVAELKPDIEAQAGEKILSELVSRTGTQIIDQTTGSNTGTKSKETQLINDLYKGYNTDDKQLIFPILDTKFKNSQEYLTYFRTTRIKKFVDALDRGMQVNNFKVQTSDNPLYKTMVTYQVQYTLQGKLYTEERNAYLVQSENGMKIKRLYCSTSNCSKGPFFNFQKFNIR